MEFGTDPSLTKKEHDFYTAALAEATEGPASTGYGHPVNQEVRFDVFDKVTRDIAYDNHWSLLDVGCGTGDLLQHLMSEDRTPRMYHGFDRDARMIEVAEKRFAANADMWDPGDLQWFEGDATDLYMRVDETMYDVVACIGVLALKPEQWSYATTLAYVKDQISRMVDYANHMAVITLWSTWKNNILPEEMNVNPSDILSWALEQYQRVDLYHSYAPHDFTLVIHNDVGKWWKERHDDAPHV